MLINRDMYLKKLIEKIGNGQIKIITGIRRCGKTFLLFNIFHQYLNSKGISDNQIIRISLDEISNARYRNPIELDKFIREQTSQSSINYFVFIDEIQFVAEIENPWLKGEKLSFVDVLLGLKNQKNLDIYVTGSNSRMLSSDVITQFRDKGDEIRLHPLSYREFCSFSGINDERSWNLYLTYGGLPRILTFDNHNDKVQYLIGLFNNTYYKDIIERNKIKNDKSVIDEMIAVVASTVGSLTNPKKLSDTFKSEKKINISSTTLDLYLQYFEQAFVLNKAFRYDIKGRKYINTPLKYYFEDVGLRNAVLGFRQQEENHIMENIIYNELIIRGFSVDVGVVVKHCRENSGKEFRKQLEVDFIANNGNKSFYIQSALNVDTTEKRLQETASLVSIPNSSKKIVVVKENILPWTDDFGIEYVGIRDFLIDNRFLN